MSGFQIIPSDPDLVAGWDMRQSPAGIIKDVGPGGFDGTLVKSPRQGTDNFGEYLTTETGKYIQVGESTAFQLQEFTLIATIRTGPSVGLSSLIGRGFLESTSSAIHYGLGLNGSGRPQIAISNGTTYQSLTFGTILNINTFYSIVAVVSSTTISLYVNNEVIMTARTLGDISYASSKDLRVAGGYREYNGSIYSAAIYSKAKSEAWVAREYDRAKLYF